MGRHQELSDLIRLGYIDAEQRNGRRESRYSNVLYLMLFLGKWILKVIRRLATLIAHVITREISRELCRSIGMRLPWGGCGLSWGWGGSADGCVDAVAKWLRS